MIGLGGGRVRWIARGGVLALYFILSFFYRRLFLRFGFFVCRVLIVLRDCFVILDTVVLGFGLYWRLGYRSWFL